jgi:hypothetical protein
MSRLRESGKNAAQAPADRSAESLPILLYVLGNRRRVENSAASADAVSAEDRAMARPQHTKIRARRPVRFPRYSAKQKFRGNPRRKNFSENFADSPEMRILRPEARPSPKSRVKRLRGSGESTRQSPISYPSMIRDSITVKKLTAESAMLMELLHTWRNRSRGDA